MDELGIVIPVYNEDHAILAALKSELESLGAEVIIVDDGSKDPFPGSIKHGFNFGYGSALMTGVKNSTRPNILFMDGDGQHTTSEVVRLYHAWKLMQETDMIIGVRRHFKESAIRFAGRKTLNWIASAICLYWLPDLNSGLRIVKRSIVMSYFSVLCRGFSFTTSITVSMMCDGYKVEWFPVDVKKRPAGKSHVQPFFDGLTTLRYILILGLAFRTRGIRKLLRSFPAWNFLTGKGWDSLERR